jgi:hypothetical protein
MDHVHLENDRFKGGNMLRLILRTALLVLLASPRAGAAILCVNPGGTGGCFSSIQAAVDAATATDEIAVAPGSYAEEIEIRAPASRTIRGAGVGLTSVNGLVEIIGGRARISDLTIVGQAAGVVLRDNSARVTIEKCVIEGASAAGLRVDEGRATLVDSTIRDNGGFGVDNSGAAGQVLSGRTRIIRSTISNNAGGGVLVGNDSVSIEDSTVSGNGGPSLYVTGKLKMRGCTVSDNALGAEVRAQYARLTIASSIFANAASGPDIFESLVFPDGQLVSRGYNVIENLDPALRLRGRIADDLHGLDPSLGPLQDNGGPSATHALLPGSSALELTTRGRLCREPDQRGVARLPAPCDAGAFEAP